MSHSKAARALGIYPKRKGQAKPAPFDWPIPLASSTLLNNNKHLFFTRIRRTANAILFYSAKYRRVMVTEHKSPAESPSYRVAVNVKHTDVEQMRAFVVLMPLVFSRSDVAISYFFMNILDDLVDIDTHRLVDPKQAATAFAEAARDFIQQADREHLEGLRQVASDFFFAMWKEWSREDEETKQLKQECFDSIVQIWRAAGLC